MSKYYGVIAATTLINVIALAPPMFSLLLYDKIVGNGLFASLVGLCCGLLLLLLLDAALKVLRAVEIERLAERGDVEADADVIGRTIGDRAEASDIWVTRYKEMVATRDIFSSSYFIALVDLPFGILFICQLLKSLLD